VETWAPDILKACEEANLEDPFLLAGLVYAESRGLADAVSSVGALGLCQLMPSTAEEIALRVPVSGPPYSGKDNLRMGAHYLVRMIRHREGDIDLALLSYRMGPGRVSREIRKAGSASEFKLQLKAKTPSPWGYRNQVIQLRDKFRIRAQQGEEAWAGWAGQQ
jgi:soluble lytic murein transglycosylase-like protein